MSNNLPLKQALERLSLNEKKFEKVVNGEEEETVNLGGKSTPTLRNFFSKLTSAVFLNEAVQRAISCAKYWALQANKIATSEAFIATGSTEARTLADRAADIVNLKDFGAKGDGVTDDTAAWEAWITMPKGIKYAPSGNYLVNGEIKSLPDGFLGHYGFETSFSTEDYRYCSFPPTRAGVKDSVINIVKNTIGTNVYPCISVEHTMYDESGGDGVQAKAAGIYAYVEQVGGNTVNAPKAICGVTVNGANGNNDSSGIVGYSYHLDKEGGIGDTAGGGMAAWQYSKQEGLVIGGEFSVHQNVTGTHPSAYAKNGNNSMCIHVTTNSIGARCFAGIAMDGQSSTSIKGRYGYWNALLISRSCFGANGGSGQEGSTYEEGTVGINFSNCTTVCPEKQMWYGNAKWHNYKSTGDIRTHCAGFALSSENTESDCIVRFVSPSPADGSTKKMSKSGSVAAYAGNLDSDGKSSFTRISHVSFADTGYLHLGTLSTSIALSGETNTVFPTSTNITALGSASHKWSEMYASNGTIQTSDERLKSDINTIPDELIDTWGKIRWVQFLFKDAIDKKGEKARLHIGLIAQYIIKVFEENGLDAFRYGIVCYDEWDDSHETVITEQIVVSPEKRTEEGELIEEAVYKQVKNVIPGTEAGYLYSVRYEEALSLEVAYQRRRAERIEERLAALEAKLGMLSPDIT